MKVNATGVALFGRIERAQRIVEAMPIEPHGRHRDLGLGVARAARRLALQLLDGEVPFRQRLAHRRERLAQVVGLVAERAGLRADETLQRIDERDLELVNRRRVTPHLHVSRRQGLSGLRAVGGRALRHRLRGGRRGAEQARRA